MKIQIPNDMKKLIFLLATAAIALSTHAQKELPEVTVIASRTTNDAEGYVTNLRGADIAKGKPAVEVLPFLPNISRENGNIKINGLAVSEIFVDGVKLTDVSELDNIPGEMIDKVRVMYLAGADRNAALSGGTIMITLRRPPEGGYYGSVTADTDWHRACGFGNEGVGGMVNYRYKNLSVYDNFHVGASRFEENAEQQESGPDLQAFMTETTKSRKFSLRNRLSVTRQFSSGAHLGGNYLIALSRPRPTSFSTGETGNSAIAKRVNTAMQQGTLKLSLPLNKKKATMELTADYLNRHTDEGTGYRLDDEMVGASSAESNLNLWKLAADVAYPRSRSLSWKFGVSAQWISSTHTPDVALESDRFEIRSVPTSTAGFTPIIYASALGKIRNLRYSAGLNWQLNRISYKDRRTDVTDRNTQWALNPVLQFMMPFGSKKNHAFMLNYKRTLNDIPYSAISSVINWENSYNYTVGNPALKAQSADMLIGGLSLFRNKVNITAIYAHSHNRIYWQTFQNEENPDVFYTKPINISGQGMWGFGAEWIDSPRKWWKFKLSARVEISPENISVGGIHYGKTRFKEYFSLNNNFRFANGWGGMLNVNLEPTYRTLDRTYHSVYSVSGRIYKTFLDDRMQLAVEFIPAGNRRKLDRKAGMNKVSYSYTSPVQFAGVSLTWNFAGGKKVDVNIIDGIQDYHETKDNR